MSKILYFLPRTAFLILWLTIPFLSFGQALRIKKLTTDFYVFTSYGETSTGKIPANGVYVVGSAGAFIIDPPWDTLQTQPLLDSIYRKHGVKVVGALATHFHGDRTASFGVLNRLGIPTYCSRQTQELCVSHGEKVASHIFLADTIFRIGKRELEVRYFGHGHSPDNRIVWDREARVLIGGCMVKSTKAHDLGNLSDANTEEWEKTIRGVMKAYSNPQYVIPGHFNWASTASLQHTLDLLMEANKSTKH
jgi:glyoxylase-like metal-dependent hydrolase (beta-lactamase superfamily II)